MWPNLSYLLILYLEIYPLILVLKTNPKSKELKFSIIVSSILNVPIPDKVKKLS